MRYGSVCSGIEATTVAWHPLGWDAAFFSEIAEFPCAVLAHHYPNVPLHGDFRTIENEYGPIDVLVGGTPCQDFSVAGLRAGIAGDRGALSIEFLHCIERFRPRWVVWENVPGVLQADGGRAFGMFLGGLAKCGYGFAFRVLDAQYFGIPQRRRRVFVVGHTDYRRSAAVLFERESLSGYPAPCREARSITPTLSRSGAGVSRIKGAVRSDELEWLDVVSFSAKNDGVDAGELAPTLRSMSERHSNQNAGGQVAIAFDTTQVTSSQNRSNPKPGDPCHPLASHAHPPAIAASGVRRLTPVECERLQGFPDDYTLVPDPRRQGKPAADQPRYHVLGNSMAVPVMRWIGERISLVESLL